MMSQRNDHRDYKIHAYFAIIWMPRDIAAKLGVGHESGSQLAGEDVVDDNGAYGRIVSSLGKSGEHLERREDLTGVRGLG